MAKWEIKPRTNSVPHGKCHCGCGGDAPIAPRTNKKLGYVKGEPVKYIRGHAVKGRGNAYWIEEDRGYKTPCWIWQGSTHGYPPNRLYAVATVNQKHVSVHKYRFEQKYGKIPDGYELHHMCEQTLCVNEDHLKLVTELEHGRIRNGVKYSMEQAIEVRRLYSEGLSQLEIAEVTGINRHSVYRMCKGEHWKE